MDLSRRLKQEVATPAVVHFFVQQGLLHYASNSPATNAAICAVRGWWKCTHGGW